MTICRRESARTCRSGAEFLEADIRDPAAVERAFQGAAGCFHLAAIASVQKSIEAPRDTSDVNLLGTATVFEAACRSGVPVVYASSAATYGANEDVPLPETALPQPLVALRGRQAEQ